MTVEEQVEEIFGEIQGSVGTHRTLVRKMVGILGESDESREEGMSTILRGCVDRVLSHGKKDAAVDRVIKFFCNFMSSADEYCFNKGLEHLLMRSCANDKVVRFRACQMLATSLAEMNQDADIPEQLFLAMTQLLIPRLRDRAANVRLWAVQAVSCLQDPEDENDLIILELLRLMGTDSSADIRIVALENICICAQSLTAVVERIRDIKPEVRVAALKALKEGNVTVRHLNATLRAQVIQYGLNDRSDKARQAARELMLSWVNDLDSKVAKLFHFLNLHSNKVDIDQATDHCSHVGWSIMHEIDMGNGDLVNQALRQGARDDAPDWEAGFVALTPADILWAGMALPCHLSVNLISRACVLYAPSNTSTNNPCPYPNNQWCDASTPVNASPTTSPASFLTHWCPTLCACVPSSTRVTGHKRGMTESPEQTKRFGSRPSCSCP